MKVKESNRPPKSLGILLGTHMSVQSSTVIRSLFWVSVWTDVVDARRCRRFLKKSLVKTDRKTNFRFEQSSQPHVKWNVKSMAESAPSVSLIIWLSGRKQPRRSRQWLHVCQRRAADTHWWQLSSSSVSPHYPHGKPSPKITYGHWHAGCDLTVPSTVFCNTYFGVESRLHHLETTHHSCFISVMIPPTSHYSGLCSLIFFTLSLPISFIIL